MVRKSYVILKFFVYVIKGIIAATTLSVESIKEQQYHNNATPNATINVSEDSVISLSTIVNILNNNSVTPRRLVDQILMAQRKKECPLMHSKSETLVSDKKSMLATTQNFTKIDENISSEDIAKKLSLDSGIKNDSKTKTDMKRSPSFILNKSLKKFESFQRHKEKLFEEAAGRTPTSSLNQEGTYKISICRLRKNIIFLTHEYHNRF